MRALWCVVMCLWPALAPAQELAGAVEAEVDGERVAFPLLNTAVNAEVRGDLATVTVVQTFVNPLPEPVHARYLFPLNHDAAVNAMTMEVGNERIRATIRRKQEARKTFEAAKEEGKAAALLEQHRPNMFTQDIANLMPGLPIRVELTYAQTVPKVDGHYELVVPLVVGPRFQPPGAGEPPPDVADADDPDQTASGEWMLRALPAYPPVFGLDIPDTVDADRVSIAVDLEAGVPIRWTASDTHPLTVDDSDPQHVHIELTDGRATEPRSAWRSPSERTIAAHPRLDNRDFVLRYELAGKHTSAGLLAARDQRGGFFSLLIEPPADPLTDDIMNRELVFVLDCSGSMSGLPMAASKAFMREALTSLRPNDSFRIIRFSDSATEFSTQALPATPTNIRRGITYTNALQGSGGTMMTSGIRQALAPDAPADAVRIVVFLTDGYIGNELDVLRLIETLRGDTRLYAFGVGTGVNRYLLEEMGRVGHGFTRYMDPTEDVDEVAKELASRIDAPVLTDIEIDWGDLAVSEVTPQRIPDLFAGQSVRVQGRFEQAGDYVVHVHGRARNSTATLKLPLPLPDERIQAHDNAIALIWARSTIADAMHALTTPLPRRPQGLDNEAIEARVTRLGLDYSLVTRWTSFVAVSELIYNSAPDGTATRDVPLPMVEGITGKAYPQRGFAGVVTPEPSQWLAMVVLALVVIGLHFRRHPGTR